MVKLPTRLFEYATNSRDVGRSNGRSYLMATDVVLERQRLPMSVADTAVGLGPSFMDSSLCQRGNAWLKQLIGGDPEEVRDPVEVF